MFTIQGVGGTAQPDEGVCLDTFVAAVDFSLVVWYTISKVFPAGIFFDRALLIRTYPRFAEKIPDSIVRHTRY